MENPKIKIFKQLGVDLIKRGQWFLNKAFGIKTVTITKDELASAVMEVTGLPRNKIALHDEQYYLTDWKVWKDIFKYDWTNHKKYLTDKYDCYIPVDLAFAFGLFFADGSCGLNKGKHSGKYGGAQWRIVNSNIDYLKRAKLGLEKDFENMLFKIKTYPYYLKGKITNFGIRKKSLFCLEAQPKKYGNRGKFIEEFSKILYQYGRKIVPSPIFDNYTYPSIAFLKGVIAGDGTKGKPKYISIGIKNERAKAELEWVMFGLGWKYRTKRLDKEYRIYYKPQKGKKRKVFCDNFAESFKSRAAEIYGLNSAGRLSVQLVNPNTGKHIGYHRANVLIALEEGNIVVYAYDPMEKMLDKWCLINKGQPIIIKNWQYLPKFIAFN